MHDERRRTDDDGRQPIAIGHLSDSGDLKIYTNSNNGLNYLIEKVCKILLICKRAILEFLNVDFILAWTVNLLKFMVFIFNKFFIICTR